MHAMMEESRDEVLVLVGLLEPLLEERDEPARAPASSASSL
jgi:hypothetical protein